VKAIEEEVGRVPSIRFGPRAIDLDILTYDSEVIDSRHEQRRNDMDDDLEGELLVPHPRLMEREFVLRPLAECVSRLVFSTEMTLTFGVIA
jgi:dihydroneopterin aldolase/2-amino-4-hydroxy-6-hydroxymethyldihydropteridine diphosphokinase/dihydropteroate synthase